MSDENLKLQPKPGFDWSRVRWIAPDARVGDRCSYCGEGISEVMVPLMLWNKAGWMAQFCENCQERHWGIETFPDLANRGFGDLARTCRVCGCTDQEPCTDEDGRPCQWVTDDLCSACAGFRHVADVVWPEEEDDTGPDPVDIVPESDWTAWRQCSDAQPDPGDADDRPDLGSCCGDCGRPAGQNIGMLQKRAPVPDKGSGCFVCDLPPDGAVAVLCDACHERLEAGEDVVRFACSGYPGENERVPIEQLTEPFEHNLTVHASAEDEAERP